MHKKRLATLVILLGYLTGCSPLSLAVMGGEMLASAAIEAAADSSAKRAENNIKKENNTDFYSGITTEQTVKSILDANGSPDDELVFQDVPPAKKILVYKRDFTTGPGYRVLLFAFDKDKNQFIFWDHKSPSEDEYKKFKQNELAANKYFKAGWYVNILAKQLNHYEEKGQHNIAYEYANKLAEQKSDIDEVNAEALNASAWFLATCKDLRFRDVSRAIDYASKAVELAKKSGNMGRTALFLDTLAAAYAEKGDFAKAEELETEAYNIAFDKNSGVPLTNLKDFKELIAVYKSGKTYAMWKYGEKGNLKADGQTGKPITTAEKDTNTQPQR